MKKTITVTRVVLFAALKIIFQLNCLYRAATSDAGHHAERGALAGGCQAEEDAPHHGEQDEADRGQVDDRPRFHFSRREILATS